MTLRRLLCAVLGHKPGHRLYRYDYALTGQANNQRPGRAYTVADCGYECGRCGQRVEQ